jgi:type VI secretion system protein ImpH
LQNGDAYDFFQAIRLLGRLSTETNGSDDVLSGLRVHPELSLDYPQSDITWVRQRDAVSGYEIETTFFGLYGVSSPLPGFYTEELFDDDWEEDQSARGFLDIIHYRLYPLLYQAWLKYRFHLNAIEQSNAGYWEILFSLMGLSGEFRTGTRQSGRLLKYAGIISQHPKSQMGLQTILADLIGDIPLRIEPCVSRRVKIIPRQRCYLGQQNHQLSENCVLGEHVEDRSGKFRICLGPVDQDEFNRIAGDDDLMKTIRDVISLFLIKPLLFEIRLLLKPGAEKPARIGDPGSGVLGKNTWLGNSPDNQGYHLTLES